MESVGLVGYPNYRRRRRGFIAEIGGYFLLQREHRKIQHNYVHVAHQHVFKGQSKIGVSYGVPGRSRQSGHAEPSLELAVLVACALTAGITSTQKSSPIRILVSSGRSHRSNISGALISQYRVIWTPHNMLWNYTRRTTRNTILQRPLQRKYGRNLSTAYNGALSAK